MEEGEVSRKLAIAFYSFLLLLGVFMYIAWGLAYGSWNIFTPENIGVYATVVLLIGFGLFGFLLYSRRQ